MKLQAPSVLRVEIVQATSEMLDAELQDPGRLAQALKSDLPADWPPQHHDADTIRYALKLLEDPANFGWGTHYFLADNALAGVGGFTGAPTDDTVEIGYSVVPSLHRRGIATKAAALLVETAFNRGVKTVTANTLPHLTPSIGVLQKLGFQPVPGTREGVVSFALQNPR